VSVDGRPWLVLAIGLVQERAIPEERS